MKKRVLSVLIVLTGIFLLYTSIVCACEGGHWTPGLPYIDSPDVDTWSMKIKILGGTESIMNIRLMDFAKVNPKENKKGLRQALGISMKEGEMLTFVFIYIDDSKDLDSYSWYPEWRRIKRHHKTEFENNEYENTALTLKEIMDTAVKLIDRDQVTVNDKTVFVLERDIDIKEFSTHIYPVTG
jgi:hypothetical protein